MYKRKDTVILCDPICRLDINMGYKNYKKNIEAEEKLLIFQAVSLWNYNKDS